MFRRRRAYVMGRRAPAPSRPDAGVTYIELVITIVLVGVVILPILAAVQSSIRGAAISNAAAEVETVLVNVVDAVSAADSVAFGCNMSGPAQNAAASQGAPWSAAAVTVEHAYLDSNAQWIAYTAAGDGTCPPAADSERPAGRVLRVRVSVTSPVEDLTRTLEVVKGEG